MPKFLIAFLLVGGTASAQPNGTFSAIEYFEPVRTDENRSDWPERVTFQDHEPEEGEIVLNGNWRLLTACSGRPLQISDIEAGKNDGLLEGYKNPIATLYFAAPDPNGLVAVDRYEHSRTLARTTNRTEQYVFRIIKNSRGLVGFSDDPEGPHFREYLYLPYSINEQNPKEVIFVQNAAGRGADLIRPFCRKGELPQIILARGPIS